MSSSWTGNVLETVSGSKRKEAGSTYYGLSLPVPVYKSLVTIVVMMWTRRKQATRAEDDEEAKGRAELDAHV